MSRRTTARADRDRGTATSAGGGVRAAASQGGDGLPFSLLYIYVLWFVVLFDPHRFIAAFGLSPFNRLATLMFLPLVVMIPLQAGVILVHMRSSVWYPLFLGFVLAAVLSVVVAPNRALAWDTAQPFVLFYLLAVATFMFVRTPRQAVPIILMLFLYQFLWWQLHARTAGRVPWHPTLANYDGYGPLMVMGIGFAFYFGLATRSTRLRWLAFVVAGGCVIGVVASLARGAFLGAAAVVTMILFRTRQKLRALMAVAAAVALISVGAKLLFPGGEFWAEMETIVTEGKSGGTGEDRWNLWMMAIEVFKERPILGVGIGNFGVFAASFFEQGEEIAGAYARNPHTLYHRSLHSIYFEVLSELGIVGSFFFLGLIVDFWRRNIRLRSPPVLARWAKQPGVDMDLRNLSLGLESAMIACLVTGAFYAAYLYMHWFYTLVSVNALIFMLAARPQAAAVPTSAGEEPDAGGGGNGRSQRRWRPSVTRVPEGATYALPESRS